VQTITFSYTPLVNQIPEFRIMTTDSLLNQTQVKSLSTVQICNCSNVDLNAVCLSTVQAVYSANVDIMACSCSSPYTGSFCETTKDFCALKPCSSSQTCTNLPPQQQTSTTTYVCCNAGLYFDSISGTCLPTTTTSTTTTTTTTIKLNTVDATALALQIALPIIAFLLLVITILIAVHIISKRSQQKKAKEVKEKAEPSIFTDASAVQNQPDKQQQPNQQPVASSKYRTGVMDSFQYKDKDFFNILEGQASRHQKTTISKPNSVISGSSFSLPISYYDHTTPYPIGAHLDDEENENEFNDQDDFGEGFQGPDDGTTDSSIEVKDIVQAFNPYVKIPRPKYENSPANLFKFVKK